MKVINEGVLHIVSVHSMKLSVSVKFNYVYRLHLESNLLLTPQSSSVCFIDYEMFHLCEIHPYL